MADMQSAPAAASTLDRLFALTAEQIATYRRDGCIRLSAILDPVDLACFQPVFRRLVDERTRDQLPLAERGTYGRAFQQVMNLWRVDAQAEAFVRSLRLARLAAELMEVDGVRLYHDQALFKEPGGGPTPWHVDQHYWPLAGDKTVTVWVPLQATTLQMGPLAFIPGSQRLDLGRGLEISDVSEAEVQRQVRLADLPVDEQPYELGDVSFHAGWTFHRAGGNHSAQPREVMTMIYVADGTRVAPPANRSQASDLASWMPGAEVGGLVDTPLNPLLWRRS